MNEELFPIFNKIDKKYKLVFICTFIFGILCHGAGMFNKYSHHDDIHSLFSLGSTVSLGRWMLEVISKLETLFFGGGHYSLPVFNSFLSLLLIAFSACIIIKLLEIENHIICLFIPAIMVSFPVITGMLGYMFTFPSYMFGLLLCIIGSYFVCKRNNIIQVIIGVVFIGSGIGVYQAFIPVFLSLLLFYLIKFVRDNNCFEAIAKESIIIFASVVSSVIFYFVMNKLFLTIYNIPLNNYQGVETMGKEPLSEYLWRLLFAYEEFLRPTINMKYYVFYANTKLVYYAAMIVGMLLILYDLTNVITMSKIKTLYLIILYSFVPAASNFIFVMCEPSTVHVLMVYGQIMPFLLVAYMLDNVKIAMHKIQHYFEKISLIILFSICVMFCRFDNECYLKAELTQQQAISYFNVLIAQIKSADGYKDGMPVCFAFIDNNRKNDTTLTRLNELEYFDIYPYGELDNYINDWAWQEFMERWCGFSPTVISVEDIVITDEIVDMPSYPDTGSIRVVDGVVIVKY